jgi:proteasome accessory factor C
VNRSPASARLRRLLSILPWLMSQPDGAPIDDVCRRFGVTREQLLADLEVVWMVGVYPYSPDTLVDVVIDRDRVSVRLADYFRHPLRMTPDQALAIVATGRSVAAARGTDPEGPLSRAIAKVAAVLGVDPTTVEVQLGEATAVTLELLERAAREHRQVELDYYSYGRDEVTQRVVDPHRVYADQGQWYLQAYCHLTEDQRIFRVDRVRAVELLDGHFDPPTQTGDAVGVFRASTETPRVTLDLARDARWVVEQYPVDHVEDLDGGRLRVVLPIAARPWLERLLLRLGPSAEIVAAPAELEESGRDAARRILRRYLAAQT